MGTSLKLRKNNGILKCAVLGLITALLTFGFFIIRYGGVLTISDDFNSQQLTFAQAAWNAIHYGGGGQWTWNLDLGSSVLTGFGFYNLGSPFYWIFLLFPKGSFPYLVGPLYILKYVVACVTAYIYLRLFTNKESKYDYAIIGALIYAFSGFQAVNLMFFHFHDVVAFFPLLLWGIETLDNKKKRPWFILAIFINCLVNYFFFIQEVIFMVIYFLFRFWGEPIKETLKKLVTCLVCGIFGVAMAAFMFLPSALYIKGNPRSEAALYLKNFVFDSKTLLHLIKGALLPGDVMPANSAVIFQNWDSPSCYMPLFGLSCVFAFAGKDKSWIKKLLIFLGIVSIFPFMTSGFLLFTAVYQRWWYMLVLIMALATVKVLEQPKEYAMSKGVLIYVIATTVFFLAIKFIPFNSIKEQMVFYNDRFTYFYIIAVAGPVLLDILLRADKLKYGIVLTATVVLCALTTGITLFYYKDDNTNEYLSKYEASINLKPIDDQYRYNTRDNVYALTGGAAGFGCFSSTIENSAHEFNILLEVDTNNSSQGRIKIPGLPELLGGKYVITTDPSSGNIVDQVSYKDTTLYVKEGTAFPIGFAMDRYIYANELAKIPFEKRGIALMNAAVILPADTAKVDPGMSHMDASEIDYDKPIEDMANAAVENSVKNFTRDYHGFKCTTDYAKDTYVYFSVPNDNGWTATIDGQKASIIDSGGMMLLKVPQGQHSVEFNYQTSGLKAGIALSAISWAAFAGLWIFTAVKSKSRKSDKAGKESK